MTILLSVTIGSIIYVLKFFKHRPFQPVVMSRALAFAAGVGSAAGLGVGDRYNRMLCHLQRFGIDAPPIMPSYCAVVPGTAPAPGPAPPSRTQQ